MFLGGWLLVINMTQAPCFNCQFVIFCPSENKPGSIFTMTTIRTLESDAFLAEIAPDPNAFQEMLVGGIMAIPQRMVDLEYIPEHHRGVWVTTVLPLDDYGQPREAFLSVFREPQNHKFRARKLFAQAPEEANI